MANQQISKNCVQANINSKYLLPHSTEDLYFLKRQVFIITFYPEMLYKLSNITITLQAAAPRQLSLWGCALALYFPV